MIHRTAAGFRPILIFAAMGLLVSACSGHAEPVGPSGSGSRVVAGEVLGRGAASTDGSTYYLAPDGSDGGTGSIDDPWATFIHASTRLGPGDTLLARGGRYMGQGGPGWAVSGEPDAPITFAAYPGETPIFDGDRLPSFLVLDGVSNLHLRDLVVTGYEPEDTGVLVVIGDSSGVTLERLEMRGNAHASTPGRWTEHLIYIGQGPVRDLVIRACRLDMQGLQGGAVHVYHDPGPVDLLVEENVIVSAHWGVLIDSDADGVVVRANLMRGNDINVEVLDERATRVVVEQGQLGGP